MTPEDIISYLTLAVTMASAFVAATNKPSAGSKFFMLYSLVELIAINFGKAKQP